MQVLILLKFLNSELQLKVAEFAIKNELKKYVPH